MRRKGILRQAAVTEGLKLVHRPLEHCPRLSLLLGDSPGPAGVPLGVAFSPVTTAVNQLLTISLNYSQRYESQH